MSGSPPRVHRRILVPQSRLQSDARCGPVSPPAPTLPPSRPMKSPDESKEPQPLSRRRFLQGVGIHGVGAVAVATTLPNVALAGEPSADATATQDPAPPTSFGPDAVEMTLQVNGEARKLKVEPRVTLLDALRERLDLTAAKKVCDRGTCGACTVLVDGQLRYSCMTLAVECVGSKIETVEGLAPAGQASAVSEAFAQCDALQCGFCTPGFVMTITHHLRNEKSPTLESAKRACQGNLCRCGTYNRVFEAAVLAATKGAGLPSGGGTGAGSGAGLKGGN